MQNPPTSAPITFLERLKTQAQLTLLVKEFNGLQPGVPLYVVKLAGLAAKMMQALRALGIDIDAGKRAAAAFDAGQTPELPEEPRADTSQHYEYADKVTHGQRKKANARALEILRQIDSGELDAANLTPALKAELAAYSGTGGNLTGADGLQGSAYEYYTPKPIADGVWSLLGELGYKGGKMLDPCAGTGIFGATAPGNTAVESIELNETSGRINQLVNGGPAYHAIVSPFEAVASRTEDGTYDAVVTNVPFGSNADRGRNKNFDPKHRGESLEWYFMCRSLEKLKHGGLAAFIVPPRVVSEKGGKSEKLRMALSQMAEFLGAYRLPNSVFGNAEADTITDVVVFRKYGADATTKIEELMAQSPETLIQANVLWGEFIQGHYFQGEGKRFVLGEFQAKDPTKYRDVDRVISDQSVPNIAKLLRKFPGSRVDWKLLDATETEPIAYNNGDSIVLAGQTLEMRDGVWVPVGAGQDTSGLEALASSLATPLAAVNDGITLDRAQAYAKMLQDTGRMLDTPIWLAKVLPAVGKQEDGAQGLLWSACCAGLATIDVANAHAQTAGFKYQAEYPALSKALEQTWTTCRKAPSNFPGDLKSAFQKARLTYNKRNGFAAYWLGNTGEVATNAAASDEASQILALRYRQGLQMDVAEVQKIMGEGFNVLESDDWVILPGGHKAMRADDFFVGRLDDALQTLDLRIQAETDEAVKAKMLRDRENAMGRVLRVDPKAMRYNLFSPFMTMEEKAEFLRRFLHPGFAASINNEGQPYIVYEGKQDTIEEALCSRIAAYVSGDAGGRGVRSLTLQGKQLPISDKEALSQLRKLAARLNTQFDTYAKASPAIMERLNAKANAPESLYFREVDDDAPLNIPGMRTIDPVTGEPLLLHGYQNAFTRKMGRRMSGILGFDVGLGKTFTALAVAQHIQSIGVKKKTMFVLPNTVLSNWKREAMRAYDEATMAQCLFVGMTQDRSGEDTVNPALYAADFTRILEGKHSKIFCTMEAFGQIPLKDATIDAYEWHMTTVDSAFSAGDKKKDRERAEGRLADLTTASSTKSNAIPFFEDMGIDSLISDEAHGYKNSKNTMDFSGGRFLSIGEASARGLDMQMKSWYVRGLSKAQDGVMPLTATPVTNSPLEIYSMLCMAAGEERINGICLGVKGADEFMNAMCVMDEYEDVTIDGQYKNYRVFTGLQNVTLLRSAISAVATIKTAEDVQGDRFKQPDKLEIPTAVQLPADVLARLEDYKMAYRAAKFVTGMAAKNAEEPTEEEMEALARVQARLGEPPELIAHPFNLSIKMSNLIVDPELDERASFYSTPNKAQAEKLIDAYNKVKREEKRARPGPWTAPEDVKGTITVKSQDGDEVLYRIAVKAKLGPDGRIVVDTTDYKAQAAFEALAEKMGVPLECRISAKIAALVANVKAERAAPRSKSGLVKQIVFCDTLGTHMKLRRILSKETGIPLAKIAIVNAKAITDPAQMQDIQDGFNEEGEGNRYELIVANKKAEVGINLQKGTQAIHHLTIGWTPDSQHQRNGRGARQGNTTALVNIYLYDADGTFDKYKRNITNAKADWIGAVMSEHGSNEVSVEQGITDEQMDAMIESMGDEGMLSQIQERAKLREALMRAENARQRQTVAVQTVQSQKEFLRKNTNARQWAMARSMEFYEIAEKVMSLRNRSTGKMRPDSLLRLQATIAELDSRLSSLSVSLVEACEFKKYGYGSPMKAEELLPWAYLKDTKQARRKQWESTTSGLKVINEDAALFEDWHVETATANAIMNEALALFTKIGEEEKGAMPVAMAASIKAGEFSTYGGEILVTGMLIEDAAGMVWGVTAQGTQLASAAGSAKYSGTIQAFMSRDTKRRVVLGQAGYAELAAKAAEIEDARELASTNGLSKEERSRMLTAFIPEVAALRKVVAKTRASRTSIGLPSPLFPYPLDPTMDDKGSPLYRKLLQEQKDTDWLEFLPDASDSVRFEANRDVQTGLYIGGSKRIEALVNYAKAQGAKLWAIDLMTENGRMDKALPKYLVTGFASTMNPPTDLFAGLDTAEAIDAKQREFVEALYTGWLEWGEGKGDFDAGSAMPAGLSWTLGNLANNAKSKILAAKAAEEAAAAAALAAEEAAKNPKPEPEPTPEPATETAPAAANPVIGNMGGVLPNAQGKIGVNGDTLTKMPGKNARGYPLQAKDFLKQAATDIGQECKWDKENQVWVTTAAVWERCCTAYPDAAKHMRPAQI